MSTRDTSTEVTMAARSLQSARRMRERSHSRSVMISKYRTRNGRAGRLHHQTTTFTLRLLHFVIIITLFLSVLSNNVT